jgi:hypothetical protein
MAQNRKKSGSEHLQARSISFTYSVACETRDQRTAGVFLCSGPSDGVVQRMTWTLKPANQCMQKDVMLLVV